AANVDERSLAAPQTNPYVRRVEEWAAREGAECVVICAQLEAELAALSPEERRDYLRTLGVESSGVDRMIRSAYRLLGL
ncbi:redox-regulated ATPase YchF, partial [Acinetobacter baumannii]